MTTSKKVAAAAVTSALVLSLTLLRPPTAGAQGSTTTTRAEPETTVDNAVAFWCSTDPESSVLLGPAPMFPAEFSFDAPFGDTVPLTGRWSLSLPPIVNQMVADAGLTTVGVSDFALTAVASGVLTGGPLSATPSSFDIPVAAPGSFTGTFDGNVLSSGNGSGAVTIVSPLTFTLTIVVPGVELPSLAVTCDPNPAEILHVAPQMFPLPTTTTTTTSETTSTTAQAGDTTGAIPRFAG